jgi:hypothetical protein
MGDLHLEWGPISLALIPLALALMVVWYEIRHARISERNKRDAH